MFICPSLGFYEFLDIELLPQIISWQHKEGCYGSMSRPSAKDSEGVNLKPVLDILDYDYVDTLKHPHNVAKGINLTDVIGNIDIGSHVIPSVTNRKLLAYVDTLWDGTVIKGRQLLVEKSMTGLLC